jgi:hypothetical protein
MLQCELLKIAAKRFKPCGRVPPERDAGRPDRAAAVGQGDFWHPAVNQLSVIAA